MSEHRRRSMEEPIDIYRYYVEYLPNGRHANNDTWTRIGYWDSYDGAHEERKSLRSHYDLVRVIRIITTISYREDIVGCMCN
jgi:hypothetical protein